MSHQSLNRFLGACRLAGPLELHAEAPAQGKFLHRSFDRPFAVIGRDARCDLPLEDEQVSQRHLYLQVLEGRVFALDLGSESGTLREDGSRDPGWLRPGEILRVGPFRVRLDGDATARPPRSADWDPLAAGSIGRVSRVPVVLEFQNGSGKGKRWRLGQAFTLVGRTSVCPLQLVHASVSKTHCSLLATAAGVWVIDLLGRSGIRVCGKPVRWACLEEGDVLEVGEFALAVHYTPEAGPPGEARFLNLMRGDFYPPVRAPSLAVTRPPEIAAAPASEAARLPVMTDSPTTAPAPFAEPCDTLPVDSGLVRPGSPEAMLMLMAQQFAAMQQRMFDQFQQSITMMVQAFGTMHRDQVTLVRGELDQLRDLTERLRALEAQLAQQPEPMAPADDAPTIRMDAPRAADGRNSGAKTEPARPAGKATARPPDPPPAQPAQPAAKPAPATPPNQDVHAWLTQQIAALQAERQSVWQKLMNSLRGSHAGEPLP